jgi:UDP-N-acetylmuramoyl-tripeptide--D-alanyl-D-alanine ligase
LGIGLEDIASGLETVQPIKGRLAPVDAPGELIILDDTYNANPISLKAGLEVLSQYSGQTWLIMGDMAELGDGEFRFHEEAGALAREYGVSHLFATGERCRHAVAAFGEGARHFDQQTDLIDAVRNSVDPGATVLVKGSRSMHMERVVDALARDC